MNLGRGVDYFSLKGAGMEGEKLWGVVKIVGVLALVIMIPRMFMDHDEKKQPGYCQEQESLSLGVDTFFSSLSWYRQLSGKRIAFVGDNLSCNSDGIRTLKLFVSNKFDVRQAFIVRSKYENSYEEPHYGGAGLVRVEEHNFSPHFFSSYAQEVDAFVVDLQNSGLIFNFSVKVFLQLLTCASKMNKEVFILDRPNIFGGDVEGPGALPFRFGLTFGELARYVASSNIKAPLRLSVVPMKGWVRSLTSLFNSADQSHLRLSSVLEPLSGVRPFKIPEYTQQGGIAFFAEQTHHLSQWELDYLKMLSIRSGIVVSFDSTLFPQHLMLRDIYDVESFAVLPTFLKFARFFGNRKSLNVSYSDNLDEIMGASCVRKFCNGKLDFVTLKKEVESSQEKFVQDVRPFLIYDSSIRSLELQEILVADVRA